MCTTASTFPLLIRVQVSGIRAHPNDLGLIWSSLWGLYLQIKLHFGFNIWILGKVIQPLIVAKFIFPSFYLSAQIFHCLELPNEIQIPHFGVQALPQPCYNVSLFFHHPACPIFLYTAIQLHYSQIPNIPHFPASKPMFMWLFLPRTPSSSTSMAHLRGPLLHYAFLVPPRHVFSTGLCFGTLLAVKDYDHCTTITLCCLLPSLHPS